MSGKDYTDPLYWRDYKFKWVLSDSGFGPAASLTIWLFHLCLSSSNYPGCLIRCVRVAAILHFPLRSYCVINSSLHNTTTVYKRKCWLRWRRCAVHWPKKRHAGGGIPINQQLTSLCGSLSSLDHFLTWANGLLMQQYSLSTEENCHPFHQVR